MTTLKPGLYETSDISNPGNCRTLATLPGAMVILADGSMVKPCDTTIGRAAVREALALLRDTLTEPSIRSGDEEHFGIAVAVQVLDRFAERFKP